MNFFSLLLLGVTVLLVLSGLAVVVWQRFYHDDAHNTVRRVLKNSAVPFVVRLIIRGLDFGFVIVLLSILEADEVGRYALAALLIGQYFQTFSEFGLGVLLTREVAKDQSNAQRLFGVTLTLRWLLAAGTVPIAALVIGGYSFLGYLGVGEPINPVGQHVIWVLLLTLVPSAYSGAVTALYNAAERMEVPAMVELFTAVISVLLRVGLLWLGFGIVGLAWAAVVVSTCTATIYLVLQWRSFFRPTLVWDKATMRYLVPLAFPLMLNNVLNAVFFRFDMFIVKAFGEGHGDQLVQQYNVAYQLINIAMVLPPVITFAVFPHLARRAMGERTSLAQAQNRTLQVLLLLAFPVAMGLCVLAPDLVRFMTRRHAADYLPISAHVLSLLAWFLPLSFINGLLQYVLIAINRQWVIARAFLIGALFNLTVNLVTIPLFGLYAASVVTILSEVVLLFVFLPFMRQEGLVPPLFTLTWRPLVGALCMGICMVWLRQIHWVVAGLGSLPIYAVVLWFLGTFGPEERALFRRVFGAGPDIVG